MSKGDIGQMISIAAQNCSSEKDQLLTLLTQTNCNRSKAARILGVSEGAVRHRIKKYNHGQGDS
jgi:DNA-binding protein Fis